MAKVGDKIEVINGHHKGKKGFIRVIGSERDISSHLSLLLSNRVVYECAPELIFGNDNPDTAVPFTVYDGEFVVLNKS
jgi:hypothetical protein